MRIVNRSDQTISYELRAGPLRMTMSECDLAPGEEEQWDSPYRTQRLSVQCELRVSVDDELVASVQASDDDTVHIDRGAGGWTASIG